MGTNQSREEKEIIVAQAGNSGGVNNGTNSYGFAEVGVVVCIILVMLIIGYVTWKHCKKSCGRRIRREVERSHELLAIKTEN